MREFRRLPINRSALLSFLRKRFLINLLQCRGEVNGSYTMNMNTLIMTSNRRKWPYESLTDVLLFGT